MADSYIDYNGDSSTVEFIWPVPFVSSGHIRVFLDMIEQATSLYTVANVDNEGATITMDTAPVTGEVLRIQRTTPSTKLVDYQPGNTFSQETLNTDTKQARFLIQELSDLGVQGSTGPTGPTGATGADGADPLSGGFADYNNTLVYPTVLDGVWTNMSNNGLGSATNLTYLPEDHASRGNQITRLMELSASSSETGDAGSTYQQGDLDFRELQLGDRAYIRNTFTIVTTSPNVRLDFRYELKIGDAGAFTLETYLGDFKDSGTYNFALVVEHIYMGDVETKNNPSRAQILATGANVTVTNAGSVINIERYQL